MYVYIKYTYELYGINYMPYDINNLLRNNSIMNYLRYSKSSMQTGITCY